MKIAAFDLGSTTAMASNAYGLGEGFTEFVDLKGERPQRFEALNRWLPAWLPKQVELVVYERPFARGQHATRSLWGYAAMIEAWAEHRGAAVKSFSPAEIKKWATGIGNAEKVDMMTAAILTGYTGSNEHEADAWCLLKMAEALITEIIPRKAKRLKAA